MWNLIQTSSDLEKERSLLYLLIELGFQGTKNVYKRKVFDTLNSFNQIVVHIPFVIQTIFILLYMIEYLYNPKYISIEIEEDLIFMQYAVKLR